MNNEGMSELEFRTRALHRQYGQQIANLNEQVVDLQIRLQLAHQQVAELRAASEPEVKMPGHEAHEKISEQVSGTTGTD